MEAKERRAEVLRYLEQAGKPVPAAAIAAEFQVSRQIIVGDIALLRAGGADITATPRGYVTGTGLLGTGISRRVACVHSQEDMGRELTVIVDAGGEVVDVVVSHPLYGEITCAMHIRSRYDVAAFLERAAACEAKPLSLLTDGIHLHTICCPDEATFARVEEALQRAGFLLR
ncbi:MAG: transcription repressor NadR [Oscillospiraceae bacterium]|nr:transcription repressor NadR [Oscillospiraceae bacterium]